METDSWLIEPMYTYEDLILEEKIAGKWLGDDGTMLDFLPMEEGIAYDVLVVESDGDEEQYFAHLVKLEEIMFMVIFRDKSLLQQEDSHGFRIVPEVLLRVGQIEPELLLQEMDYEEVFGTRTNEQGKPENTEYVFEGVKMGR